MGLCKYTCKLSTGLCSVTYIRNAFNGKLVFVLGSLSSLQNSDKHEAVTDCGKLEHDAGASAHARLENTGSISESRETTSINLAIILKIKSGDINSFV